MDRSALALIAIFLVYNFVHGEDVKHVSSAEKSSDSSVHKDDVSDDKQIHEVIHPESHTSEIQQADPLHSEKQDNKKQHSTDDHDIVKHSEDQHAEVQNSEVQHTEMQHSEDQHSELHHSDVQNAEPQQSSGFNSEPQKFAGYPSKKNPASGRQFHQPPQYYPVLFQQPSGFEAIRRQFGGGLGSDLVMVGLISLPIIGLLTMGSASLGNLFGLGLSSSNSKKSSSKRNKRSLKEKAADAVEYAKSLWNVMEQLEKAFEKYDLYQAECRLRVVCEAHHKDRRMGTWGQSILDLMRQQKELEGRELLPVSRFLFSNYAEAAQAGARSENCAQLYTGCPRHLSYYLSAKEDQMENEVENGM